MGQIASTMPSSEYSSTSTFLMAVLGAVRGRAADRADKQPPYLGEAPANTGRSDCPWRASPSSRRRL